MSQTISSSTRAAVCTTSIRPQPETNGETPSRRHRSAVSTARSVGSADAPRSSLLRLLDRVHAWNLGQPGELDPDHLDRAIEPPPVRRRIQPAARTGRMRQRHDGDAVDLEALADALGERGMTEQRSQREPAGGDDQLRAKKLQLPAMPERAQLALTRRRRAVASARRSAAGVAARHRSAVERRVERVLVELEPAAERLPRTAAPGQSLLALDDAGRLPVEIRALLGERRAHRERLEREAFLDARAAAGEVALQGCKRPIR